MPSDADISLAIAQLYLQEAKDRSFDPLLDILVIPLGTAAQQTGTDKATLKNRLPIVQMGPRKFGVRYTVLRAYLDGNTTFQGQQIIQPAKQPNPFAA